MIESAPPIQSVFIHSSLDEAGLSPAEFRVLCHIARRGDCYATIDTIAEVCRMATNTVRKALKSLAAQSFVRATRRDGQTTLHRLTPVSDWKPYAKTSPLPKDGRATKRTQDTPTKPIEDTPTKRDTQSISPEGNPSKAIPIKGSGALKSKGLSVELTPHGKLTLGLLERFREALGEDMKDSAIHKWCYERTVENPAKCQRVIADVEDQIRKGTVKKTPAALAIDNWNRFV
jgi:hypothetical protein